jgi:hypothetical protein
LRQNRQCEHGGHSTNQRGFEQTLELHGDSDLRA